MRRAVIAGLGVCASLLWEEGEGIWNCSSGSVHMQPRNPECSRQQGLKLVGGGRHVLKPECGQPAGSSHYLGGAERTDVQTH